MDQKHGHASSQVPAIRMQIVKMDLAAAIPGLYCVPIPAFPAARLHQQPGACRVRHIGYEYVGHYGADNVRFGRAGSAMDQKYGHASSQVPAKAEL